MFQVIRKKPSREETERWLSRADIPRLEQLVLEGQGDCLKDLTSAHVKSRAFLKSLPTYQMNIHSVLKAVVEGNLDTLRSVSGYKNVLKAKHPLTGATTLHLAVIWMNSDIVRFLLNKWDKKMLDSVDQEQRTALHYAAIISNSELDQTFYDLIKEAGANEFCKDSEDFSPSYYLEHPGLVNAKEIREANKYPVALSSKDETDMLIDQNMKHRLVTMILDGKGYKLKNKTFPVGSVELERQLLAMVRRVEAIHQSIIDGDSKTFKQLVDKKRYASARNSVGDTPIHCSILRQQLPIAEYLIRVFPDCVNDKNLSNRSALHYASLLPEGQDNQYFNLLLSAGADEQLKDYLGRAPNFYLKHPKVSSKILRSLKSDKHSAVHSSMEDTKTKSASSSGSSNPSEKELKLWLQQNDLEPLKDMLDRGQRKTLERWGKRYPQVAEFLKTAGKDKGKNREISSVDSQLGSDHSANEMETGMSSEDGTEDYQLNESQIDEWLQDGDIENLERIVLEGRIHLLRDKQTAQPESREFLAALTQYQAKIEAIFKAVEEGDVRRVKNLIDRAALARAKDRKGLTPLHKAVIHGQTDTIRYILIKFPETVNVCDHEGRAPLHFAAADRNGGHYVKLLQKAGADAFIEDKVVSREIFLVHDSGLFQHGHTPFYYQSNPEQLNLQMIKDAAVMDQLMFGELPRPLLQDLEDDILDWLHTGNLGKLEELVLNGYGDLLLGKAHEVEDRDVLNFLEILPQYQAKISSIHRNVEQGSLKEVSLESRVFRAVYIQLNYVHTTSVLGENLDRPEKVDIAKHLLRNYPQAVNAQDHRKLTPLHYAAATKDGGFFYKLLRKAAADPNIPDGVGRTAKYYLQHKSELQLDRLRLDSRSALRQALQHRVAPSYLESSIQQWLRDGNVGKLEQLVLSGCGDLLFERTSNNPDSGDFLASLDEYLEKIDHIHKCVRSGNVKELNEFLEQHRKLVIGRDRKGSTPLHDAVLYEQTEVLRFFAETYPITLNSPDYNKRTPLHYAAAARDGRYQEELKWTAKYWYLPVNQSRPEKKPILCDPFQPLFTPAHHLGTVANWTRSIGCIDVLGGHYYKILEKAGADPKAVDNEGHSPEYYRRNFGALDLKAIKDRDREVIVELEGYLSDPEDEEIEGRMLESENSENSIPTPRSNIGMSNGFQPSFTAREGQHAFTEALEDKLNSVTLDDNRPLPTSENGLYLAKTVGPVLTRALAEVVIKRPEDPLGYVANWLYQYHTQMKKESEGN